MVSIDAQGLLESLNDEQLAAVTAEARHLCILAGAGSGKTRVLTRRIAHRVATGDADPRHVLALTFTRRAAGELTSRLRSLGMRDSVAAGTFHAIALAQLRTRWDDKGIRAPEILDRKVGFIARLLPRDLRSAPLDIVSEIEWAKARCISPPNYVDAITKVGRTPPIDGAALADIFEQFEIEKRNKRLVDFDDLLRLWARELTKDQAFGDAQRWRFRHLFVDEFQDLNPLQYSVLDAWLGEQSDLCVVGDPNQAIYAWNGADADYINRFDRYFPGAVTVSLRRNHRSTPQILAAAEAVLRSDQPDVAGFEPVMADGPLPTIQCHDDDKAEAKALVRAVRDNHRPGARWGDQAILTRTNAQLAVIEEALRVAGVPHRARGGSGLIDQPEVRKALDRMRRSHTPLAALVTDLRSQLDELGEPEPDETAGPDAAGDDDAEQRGGEAATLADRRANLGALLRLAQDHLALDADASADRFANWLLSMRAAEGDARPGDAVELATFHAAKGLEWPIVHLAGIERGLVPIGYAKTPEALAEETRLLYVALTRAERRVTVHWAMERSFGNRVSNRHPSRYLTILEATIDALRDGRSIADIRSIDRARAALGADGGKRTARKRRASAGSDDPVLASLREWRRNAARAADVPAFVIFHDSTLEAVAEARPSSKRALRSLPGIGPVKLERYGDDLLSIVAQNA